MDNDQQNQSSDNDISSGLKALLIEGGVILVLVIIIFGVLNYFRVFPLSQISPTLFGWLPQQATQDVPVQSFQDPIDADLEEGYSITVRSEVPGYEVVLNDEEQLINLLTSWNIFGENYNGVHYAEGSTNGTPVNKIVIRLTSQEQKNHVYATPEGDTYLSANVIITPGQLDAYIHLGDLYFNGGELSEKKGTAVLSMFLQSMYRLNYYLLPVEERLVKENNALDVIGEIIQDNPNYFEVNSK